MGNNVVNVNKSDLGYLGEDYQKKLVKCFIEDQQYFIELYNILDQNKFTNDNLRRIVGYMKDRYAEVEVVPTYSELKMIIRTRVADPVTSDVLLSFLVELYNMPMESIDIIKDSCSKFFKQQNLIRAMKEADDIIRIGDFNRYDDILQKIQKAIEVNEQRDGLAWQLYDSIESDLSENYRIAIPTGADKLDEALYGGLGKGQLGIIIAPMGTGKAQPLTSKVLTPSGFKTMGDIKAGSDIIGYDGKPHKVIGVFPQGIRPVYKVTFSDGSIVECDEEHLWNVNAYCHIDNDKDDMIQEKGLGFDYGFETLSLKDIIKRGIHKESDEGRVINVFKIPKCNKVNLEYKHVCIDPYLMGYYIGNSCLSCHDITIESSDIDDFKHNISHINDSLYSIDYHRDMDSYTIILKDDIKEIFHSIFNKETEDEEKFIPSDYCNNSIDNRIALLQGLLDSNGTVNDKGIIEFNTKSKRLADDIKFLAKSLGTYVTIDYGMHYHVRMIFTDTSVKPFGLKRKLKWIEYHNKDMESVCITDIEYLRQDYTQCILVDSDDHLYITDDFIVTHNTSATTGFAANAALHKCEDNNYKGWKVLHVFFEDTEVDIRRKYYGFATNYDAMLLSDPSIRPHVIKMLNENNDINRMLKENIRCKRLDSLEKSASDIEMLIKREIAVGFKPDLVIIDYFECLAPERVQYSQKGDSWEKEGITIRKLEKMTHKFNIGMWIPVQGNRESIGLEKVGLAQGGGSIRKTQAAHVVLTFAQTDDQKPLGKMNVFLAKLRSGKIVRNQFFGVHFNNGTCKFDMSNIDADTEAIENNSTFEKQQQVSAQIAKNEYKRMNKT